MWIWPRARHHIMYRLFVTVRSLPRNSSATVQLPSHLLLAGRCGEGTSRGRCHGVSGILSPSQAVKLDVLVIDQSSTVDLAQREALNIRVWAWSNTKEAPLPNERRTVDDEIERINPRDGRSRECIVEISRFVSLNDRSKLVKMSVRRGEKRRGDLLELGEES